MPRFSEVEVGQELGPLTKVPGRAQLVAYAAGSGDFNPLHFDPEFPQAIELGENLVHGRMKYAAMGQLVSDWLAHTGRLRRISAQYRGMDHRGAPFTTHGIVSGLHEEGGARIAELELWTESAHGWRTTLGTAEVVLHR